ncbi:c-type cytochrome [Novosphingobium tardum]|jgi:cytochrome c|uniref:C-type cytochrome n=1 Tax=Novosphingobium tardum TaxID=1538021 RepID=A0ABV8RNV2_9SPHN
MDDRFNTIAGWTLFGGIVALGLSSVSGHYFEANKNHRPEKMGYEIEGVEAEGGAAAAAVPLPTLLAAADPAKGQAVFNKCTACHTIVQGGPNGIGPNLYGTVGEGIGQGKGGFAFSDALKSHGGNWTFENLDAWLTSPKKFANGTKMTFAGLSNAEDRANLIVYLNAQGSNLPLPKAEAAPAAAAPDSGADVAKSPAGGASAKTDASAAGAVAQPAPAAEGGGDKAVGNTKQN